jgi:protein gp37
VSQNSAIEWTEATWNPTTGCDRISPGCDHCYALTLAGRLKGWASRATSATATRARPAPGSG